MDALERGSCRSEQVFVFTQNWHTFCAVRGCFLEVFLLKLVLGLPNCPAAPPTRVPAQTRMKCCFGDGGLGLS